LQLPTLVGGSLNFGLSLHAGAFFVGFGGGGVGGFKCFKWFKYFSGGAYIFGVLEGFGGVGVKLTR
jgi:hypothetical protein